jgi:hypothetical protein
VRMAEAPSQAYGEIARSMPEVLPLRRGRQMTHRPVSTCSLLLLARAWPVVAQSLGAVQISGKPEPRDPIKPRAAPRLKPNRIGTVARIELQVFMEAGNAMDHLQFRRDDVVYVPGISERIVSALDEIKNTGTIPLAHNSTIARLKAHAGALTCVASLAVHAEVL